MSLLDGLILHTINEGETQSNHSRLMEFYSLEKEINVLENKRWSEWEKAFDLAYTFKSKEKKVKIAEANKQYNNYDLSLMFMRVKAITIVKTLK